MPNLGVCKTADLGGSLFSKNCTRKDMGKNNRHNSKGGQEKEEGGAIRNGGALKRR